MAISRCGSLAGAWPTWTRRWRNWRDAGGTTSTTLVLHRVRLDA